MIGTRARAAVRSAAVLSAVASLVWVLPTATAVAVAPPVDPDVSAAPPDGPPGPDTSMRKQGGCLAPGVMPNSDLSKPPPPSTALRLDQAHKFSTGAGVIVAVIDTGVHPQPRLVNMIPGGDYIDPGAGGPGGFEDCDGHGTAVAGIIGAAPSPNDGLVGVAPNAQILAIRQSSEAYMPENTSGDPNDPNNSQTAGNIRSVARAIVHAVNLGAKVINISVVSCIKVTQPIDQAILGGALRYALDVKDALVVAAAGNVNAIDTGNSVQSTCQNNPDVDPSRPMDPRNWAGVTAISTPSWFDDLVLSVGFVSPDGIRAQNSMAGPWVDVAAPGSGIVSLSAADGAGVINGMPNKDGKDAPMVPLAGTSFAAAYVSGTAALLRSRFPNLSARQIAARIIATAHQPPRGVDNEVGHGMIDPVAALTYTESLTGEPAITVQAAKLALPPPPPAPDTKPQKAAGIVIGAVVSFFAVVAIVVVSAGLTRKSPNE